MSSGLEDLKRETLRTLPGDDVRQIMWRFAERFDLQMVVQSSRAVARGPVARIVRRMAVHLPRRPLAALWVERLGRDRGVPPALPGAGSAAAGLARPRVEPRLEPQRDDGGDEGAVAPVSQSVRPASAADHALRIQRVHGRGGRRQARAQRRRPPRCPGPLRIGDQQAVPHHPAG